jgi:hypothetical protein
MQGHEAALLRLREGIRKTVTRLVRVPTIGVLILLALLVQKYKY